MQVTLINHIIDNNISEVKSIIKDFSPARFNNEAIGVAAERGNFEIVFTLLWKEECVKKTLKNDNLEVYNYFIQQDIQKKIGIF